MVISEIPRFRRIKDLQGEALLQLIMKFDLLYHGSEEYKTKKIWFDKMCSLNSYFLYFSKRNIRNNEDLKRVYRFEYGENPDWTDILLDVYPRCSDEILDLLSSLRGMDFEVARKEVYNDRYFLLTGAYNKDVEKRTAELVLDFKFGIKTQKNNHFEIYYPPRGVCP